jgi:glycosyltransferase involved in cell wall biosynthesis
MLFLTTHLNAGGITSYLYLLSKGLIDRGHDVFIVSSGGDQEPSFVQIGAKLKVLNIKTKSELSPRIYLALKPLRDLIRKQDISLIHAQTRVTQVMGFWLGRQIRKPVLSTCHGFFKSKWSRLLFPCWGDHIIAISPAVEKHLVEDFRVKLNNITVIPHGIPFEKFSPLSQEEKMNKRKIYDFGQDPLIGIIARLSDVKGHDVLIRAMQFVLKDIPSAKLLIVGEGKQESALRVLVAELDLQDCVFFYPIVNKAADILPLFDAFVMPSFQEGLGLAVIEAQACGLPVVASRVGGLTSLIEDGETGFLVKPGDVEALAGTIVKVLKNKELAADLGAQAREAVRDKFTVERMVVETLSVYEKVVQQFYEKNFSR